MTDANGDLAALRLRPAILTIDGPAASGKSTIGHTVAGLLDYLFFDTGIMYRAITWAAVSGNVPVEDEAAVTRLAERADIDLAAPNPEQMDGRQTTVLLDGADITWQTRTPEVDRNVSVVAAYPGVRAALTRQQQRIAHRYGQGDVAGHGCAGIVLVGRDTGTVVAPDAAVKIFMVAGAEERARRRAAELALRGREVAYADVLRDIIRRDEIDSARDVAPLRAADDAVVIDTTSLTIPEVVAAVVAAVRDHSQ